MPFRFFQVPAYGDDAENALNQFLEQNRIVQIDREFVGAAQGGGHWAFCVEYLADPARTESEPTKPKPGTRRPALDYREVLDSETFAVFAKLRQIRKQLADAEGVPPYSVANNGQLSGMATNRVATEADLRAIAGFGETRLAKYGADLLKWRDLP